MSDGGWVTMPGGAEHRTVFPAVPVATSTTGAEYSGGSRTAPVPRQFLKQSRRLRQRLRLLVL